MLNSTRAIIEFDLPGNLSKIAVTYVSCQISQMAIPMIMIVTVCRLTSKQH